MILVYQNIGFIQWIEGVGSHILLLTDASACEPKYLKVFREIFNWKSSYF